MVTMTNVDFITRQIKMGTQDTQWWVQLSTAIVFGLIFATIINFNSNPFFANVKRKFNEMVS